jgi:glycosyltransferase involved in cell wall biosynthesis
VTSAAVDARAGVAGPPGPRATDPLAVAFAATVDPTEIGGSGIATAHTAIALAREPGVSVTLLCPRPRHAPTVPGLEDVLARGRFLPGKPARGGRVVWNLRSQLPMWRALRTWARREPDGVIVARLAPGLIAPALVARRLRMPYLLLVRGMPSRHLRPRGRGQAALADWVVHVNARAADRVYAAFDEARAWIAGHRARGQAPVQLLPNAVDPALFRPLARDDARRALGLAPDAFVTGFVGSLNPRHVLAPLVEATARICRAGSRDVQLLVVGDGPERPALEALARAHGIAERVRFVGRVSHAGVPAHVAACDVLYGAVDPTAPSNPIKCYEYLACARPILTSARPEFEFVAREGIGQVLRAVDASSIQAALEALAALGAEARRAMGERGRRLVLDGHSWDAFAATLVRDAREVRAASRAA